MEIRVKGRLIKLTKTNKYELVANDGSTEEAEIELPDFAKYVKYIKDSDTILVLTTGKMYKHLKYDVDKYSDYTELMPVAYIFSQEQPKDSNLLEKLPEFVFESANAVEFYNRQAINKLIDAVNEMKRKQ